MKRDLIKQANMLQNITIEELELLKQLLGKVNNIYGIEVREKMTEHQEDCLYQAKVAIKDYLEDIE